MSPIQYVTETLPSLVSPFLPHFLWDILWSLSYLSIVAEHRPVDPADHIKSTCKLNNNVISIFCNVMYVMTIYIARNSVYEDALSAYKQKQTYKPLIIKKMTTRLKYSWSWV